MKTNISNDYRTIIIRKKFDTEDDPFYKVMITDSDYNLLNLYEGCSTITESCLVGEEMIDIMKRSENKK